MATESVNNAEHEAAPLTEEELNRLANFGALIDDAAMERIEDVASSRETSQGRRCALIVLARDADTSSNFSIEEPEAFGEMRQAVESYRDHAKSMLEMAETACVRLAIADARAEAEA